MEENKDFKNCIENSQGDDSCKAEVGTNDAITLGCDCCDKKCDEVQEIAQNTQDKNSDALVDSVVDEDCDNEGVDDCHSPAYADKFVESISPESVATRMAKLFKLNGRTTTYVFAIIYAFLGLACAIFSSSIVAYFPYIVGSFVALLGAVMFINAIITKEYRFTIFTAAYSPNLAKPL